MTPRAPDLDGFPAASSQVLAVRIDPSTLGEVLDRLDQLIERRGSGVVHLCNAWNAVLAEQDAQYAHVLNRGTMNLADGMSVVWASRLLGATPKQERISGTQLMLAACRRGLDRRVRHYLCGGTPDVTSRLEASLTARFPGIQIVGTESPPFRSLTEAEEHALAAKISRSGADLVWVGLGTPKQDYFIDRMRSLLDVGALLAVGAAFDFLSGSKPSAPAWMQENGLEWAFRLSTEPRRLGRRYVLGNTAFILGVTRQGWRHRGRPADGPGRMRSS